MATHPTSKPDEANTHKFLTFCLGVQEYGVEILRVREIIGLIPITPLPRAPEHVRGVMNLRGRIIPVLDLRARFALPAAAATKETCIVVVEGGEGSGDAGATGIIVDSVREVQDIAAGAIEPAPEFGASVPMGYIRGMGKVREKVVILLDIARVLSTSPADELQVVS